MADRIDLEAVRAQFPGLASGAAFFDNPAGTPWREGERITFTAFRPTPSCPRANAIGSSPWATR
jgi:hypothetical protein